MLHFAFHYYFIISWNAMWDVYRRMHDEQWNRGMIGNDFLIGFERLNNQVRIEITLNIKI